METRKVICRLLESQVIENRVLEGKEVDVDDIHLVKKDNISLAGNQPYVILVVAEQFSTITPEAMNLTSSQEFQQNTIAKALMINSLPHKIVGNFYLNIKKPAIKTKLFTDQEKAMEWLRKELKKELV